MLFVQYACPVLKNLNPKNNFPVENIFWSLLFLGSFRVKTLSLSRFLFSGTRNIIFGALEISNCPFENINILPAILDGMVDSVALTVYEYLKGL